MLLWCIKSPNGSNTCTINLPGTLKSLAKVQDSFKLLQCHGHIRFFFVQFLRPVWTGHNIDLVLSTQGLRQSHCIQCCHFCQLQNTVPCDHMHVGYSGVLWSFEVLCFFFNCRHRNLTSPSHHSFWNKWIIIGCACVFLNSFLLLLYNNGVFRSSDTELYEINTYSSWWMAQQ